MGAISIKTTDEMDLFLLQKRIDLKKKGISVSGNNHVVLKLIEEAMGKSEG